MTAPEKMLCAQLALTQPGESHRIWVELFEMVNK